MFAARAFPDRYFPPRYFAPIGDEEGNGYFPARYFAVRYYPPRYWPGGANEGEPEPEPEVPAVAAAGGMFRRKRRRGEEKEPIQVAAEKLARIRKAEPGAIVDVELHKIPYMGQKHIDSPSRDLHSRAVDVSEIIRFRPRPTEDRRRKAMAFLLLE